ncbi:MAG: ATP-binding protein [Bacteroidetes bacterium]|nr:ATP-binding protein [Bacteroidota bacterium]
MMVEKYERTAVQRIVQRVSRVKHMRLVAITGPRQVGKTTIAHQVRQHLIQSCIPCWYLPMDRLGSSRSDWITLQNIDSDLQISPQPTEQTLVSIWERARKASLMSEQGLVLFLDEIQTVPRWSNIVKGLWDADKVDGYPLRVVILGSAAWRMLIGRNESLAGRFDAVPVTHWSFDEMKQVFRLTLDEYIFFGGYPGPFSDQWHPGISLSEWKNYVASSIMTPIIDRDIMGHKRIDKPGLMSQIIDIAPSYSGQIISLNKLLGILQDKGNITSIADYLNLLSDAGILATMYGYSSTPHKMKSTPPKLNVLNTALMTYMCGYTLQEAKNDQSFWGRIVESAVGAHLYNSKEISTRICYWRDKNGDNEVDYVVARGPHLLGIEVKSGEIRSLHGCFAFKERFPHAKTTVVGPNGIPLDVFLSGTADDWIDQLCT